MRRAARVAWSAALLLIGHEGLELSGYAAFTALLSLFPSILFLTALAGFVGDAAAAQRVQSYLFDLAPNEVAAALRPVIVEVLTQRHLNLLTFSIVFALWSASTGVEALRTILNRSYGLRETRPIWLLRSQSLLFVVGGTAVLVVLSALLLLGPLPGLLQWIMGHQMLWAALRYSSALLLVAGALVIVHIILPNAHMRIGQVWPGAVVTTLLWGAGVWLFSLYVDNFTNFSITYGSIGGIILTLLFFDLAAIIFSYGGELNAVLCGSDRPGGAWDGRSDRIKPTQ